MHLWLVESAESESPEKLACNLFLGWKKIKSPDEYSSLRMFDAYDPAII